MIIPHHSCLATENKENKQNKSKDEGSHMANDPTFVSSLFFLPNMWQKEEETNVKKCKDYQCTRWVLRSSMVGNMGMDIQWRGFMGLGWPMISTHNMLRCNGPGWHARVQGSYTTCRIMWLSHLQINKFRKWKRFISITLPHFCVKISNPITLTSRMTTQSHHTSLQGTVDVLQGSRG